MQSMHINASFTVIQYVTRYYANQIYLKKRLSQQLFEALPMTVTQLRLPWFSCPGTNPSQSPGKPRLEHCKSQGREADLFEVICSVIPCDVFFRTTIYYVQWSNLASFLGILFFLIERTTRSFHFLCRFSESCGNPPRLVHSLHSLSGRNLSGTLLGGIEVEWKFQWSAPGPCCPPQVWNP